MKKVRVSGRWRAVLWSTGVVFLLCMIATIVVLGSYYRRAREYDLAKLGDFEVSTLFLDIHGDEIGRLFVENRVLLTHDQIPDLARHAVMAVEDKNFYKHHGIDFSGIARALVTNLRHGSTRQGGSTITQQLAKHLIGNFDRTFDRKMVEAFLALRIEHAYSKDQILDFYLNRIYFGKGFYGLGAAAKGYFGKDAHDLNIEEAALLAGIIKAPTSRSPRNNPKKAREWRNYSIQRMLAENYISSDDAKKAISTPLNLTQNIGQTNPGGVRSYFMAYAAKELEDILGREDESSLPQGLRVYTTLDLTLQKSLETQCLEHMQMLDSSQAAAGGERLQPAIIAMDVHTGAIRTLIGGRNFMASPFDRATMARRENGSILYPMIYSLAFEKLKLHPATMVNATFIDVNHPEAAEYSLGDPNRDLTKRFLTIQDALAFENKACALRVLHQLDSKQVAKWMTDHGMAKTVDPAQLEVGAPAISLLEACSFYQTLANAGQRESPHAIQMIKNSRDDVLYETKSSGKKVLDSVSAQQTVLTLKSALKDGWLRKLESDHRLISSIAAMEGYSDGYRDAWTVGFDPSNVIGVWVGNDQPVSIGGREFAAQSVVPLWGKTMKTVQMGAEQKDFSVPNELVKVEIDRETGSLKGVGFMTPAPGNIFVYVDKKQRAQIPREVSRKSEDPADWLSTMENLSIYSNSNNTPLPEGNALAAPQLIHYRIPGIRGRILAAEGQPLAMTVQSQSLALSWPAPEIAVEDKDVLAWVRSRLRTAKEVFQLSIRLSDEDILEQYHNFKFKPLVLVDNLADEEVAAFSRFHLEEQGFSLQGSPRRFYPNGSLFSHGVGFVKRSESAFQKKYQADQVICDAYNGAFGLEGLFDNEITGREGMVTILTNSKGYARTTTVDRQASQGMSVRTTIDPKLQAIVEAGLKTSPDLRSGAMVVLDVESGDVVAMASVPDFNPNRFLPALSPQDWRSMTMTKKTPLLNRAYQQGHPPGSTFKVITSIAAMRAGVLDPRRVVHCPGYYQVGNITFNFPNETQDVSYRSALARSCNTYFMDLGLRTGKNYLVETAREFGIGQETGFILPNEQTGLMPDQKFVLAVHHRNMGLGDVANTSIGQGDVLVTPLQAANFMAAIANGGTLYRPRLVSQIEDSNGLVVKKYPVETIRKIDLPSQIGLLKEAMTAVVDEGTAMAAQIPGVTMAAKTGTAQVGTKLHPRQIAWVDGFLPAENPKYSFAIMVEGDYDQDLHGGTTAGPIVAQIFARYYSKSVVASAP